jgi:hypothetical protein
MPGWKGIVGTSYTPDEFDQYCHTLQWNAWRPSFIVLHNTATPSLAQRPNGLTMQHIQNLEAFDSGRGLQVRKNTVAALATLCAILGIDSHTMRIHREDPLTTHACPGKNVRKLEVIQEGQDLIVARHAGEHLVQPVA